MGRAGVGQDPEAGVGSVAAWRRRRGPSTSGDAGRARSRSRRRGWLDRTGGDRRSTRRGRGRLLQAASAPRLPRRRRGLGSASTMRPVLGALAASGLVLRASASAATRLPRLDRLGLRLGRDRGGFRRAAATGSSAAIRPGFRGRAASAAQRRRPRRSDAGGWLAARRASLGLGGTPRRGGAGGAIRRARRAGLGSPPGGASLRSRLLGGDQARASPRPPDGPPPSRRRVAASARLQVAQPRRRLPRQQPGRGCQPGLFRGLRLGGERSASACRSSSARRASSATAASSAMRSASAMPGFLGLPGLFGEPPRPLATASRASSAIAPPASSASRAPRRPAASASASAAARRLGLLGQLARLPPPRRSRRLGLGFPSAASRPPRPPPRALGSRAPRLGLGDRGSIDARRGCARSSGGRRRPSGCGCRRLRRRRAGQAAALDRVPAVGARVLPAGQAEVEGPVERLEGGRGRALLLLGARDRERLVEGRPGSETKCQDPRPNVPIFDSGLRRLPTGSKV